MTAAMGARLVVFRAQPVAAGFVQQLLLGGAQVSGHI